MVKLALMVKFYKTGTPQNRVVLANQQAIEFTTLDRITGYFATDSDYVQQEFLRFQREQRYAISEITQAEFMAEYVEKKKQGTALKPLWREEFGKGSVRGLPLLQQLGPQAVAAAVAVVKPQPRPQATAIETVAPPGAKAAVPAPQPSLTPPDQAAATPPVEYVPVIGKRRGRPRKIE